MTDWKETLADEKSEGSKEKKARKPYEVKEGFVRTPLLRGKHELEPILDEVYIRKGLICGGYVRYCASQRPDVVAATDVDIYPEDNEAFDALKEFLSKRLEVKAENDMALTYKRATEGRLIALPPVQLIKPVIEGAIIATGKVEVILENFDFTVIRAGIVPHKEFPYEYEALVDANFHHDEGQKILRILNIHCPISSTLRYMKYARKGYWARPMEVLKLFLDWDNRDDEYRNKLRDFLEKANKGEGLSREEVDHLEAMMRID